MSDDGLYDGDCSSHRPVKPVKTADHLVELLLFEAVATFDRRGRSHPENRGAAG
jgi:hypothetical protein